MSSSVAMLRASDKATGAREGGARGMFGGCWATVRPLSWSSRSCTRRLQPAVLAGGALRGPFWGVCERRNGPAQGGGAVRRPGRRRRRPRKAESRAHGGPLGPRGTRRRTPPGLLRALPRAPPGWRAPFERSAGRPEDAGRVRRGRRGGPAAPAAPRPTIARGAAGAAAVPPGGARGPRRGRAGHARAPRRSTGRSATGSRSTPGAAGPPGRVRRRATPPVAGLLGAITQQLRGLMAPLSPRIC